MVVIEQANDGGRGGHRSSYRSKDGNGQRSTVKLQGAVTGLPEGRSNGAHRNKRPTPSRKHKGTDGCAR
jgi:hypothetical protein